MVDRSSLTDEVEEAKALATEFLENGRIFIGVDGGKMLQTLLTALQAREEENARLSSECGKLASRCLHEAQGKQALQSALAEALGAMEPFARGYHAAFSGLADEVDVRLDATFALENRRAVCTHKPVSVKVGTLRLASNTHSRLTNREGGGA